ncbi:MAG TPA: single-stranded DNA-binding protein [Gemmatimonadaceae bacterium]|jgi:single-strand DNA-binding protein
MSRSLNRVSLIGNLGADPEVRTTSTGTKVAQFSIATSRQWNDPDGKRQERTDWHKCIAWNRSAEGAGLADIMESYARKGDKVFVEGRLEYRQYDDKEGRTHHVAELNVREVVLLSPRKAADDRAVPAQAASAPF